MPGKCRTFSEPLTRDRIERAARIYRSNREAAQALGCNPNSFGRACRKYGIKTPKERRNMCEEQQKNPPVECLSGTRPGAPRKLDPKIHLHRSTACTRT